jgi:glycine cleavage system H lipoate-binding protein
MWLGILVLSAIITGVVGAGWLFKVKVVDRLDRFEDYEERSWM